MKILLIIVVIVILGIAGVKVYENLMLEGSVDSGAPTEIPAQITPTENAVTTEETSVSQDDEGSAGVDTTFGTDVGMELPPIIDDEGVVFTPAPSPKVFAIAGENFSYNVKEIRVKKGDTVTINFSSTSGFHDWVVDEFDAKTERIQTGGKTSVTFVADKAGTFEYYCSVGSHRANGMVGKLIVE